jgi:hypothetical protein
MAMSWHKSISISTMYQTYNAETGVMWHAACAHKPQVCVCPIVNFLNWFFLHNFFVFGTYLQAEIHQYSTIHPRILLLSPQLSHLNTLLSYMCHIHPAFISTTSSLSTTSCLSSHSTITGIRLTDITCITTIFKGLQTLCHLRSLITRLCLLRGHWYMSLLQILIPSV